jgi:hypothetical protein
MDEDSEVFDTFLGASCVRNIVQCEAIAQFVELVRELRYGRLRQIPEFVSGCDKTGQQALNSESA